MMLHACHTTRLRLLRVQTRQVSSSSVKDELALTRPTRHPPVQGVLPAQRAAIHGHWHRGPRA